MSQKQLTSVEAMPSTLDASPRHSRTDSDVSGISFKHWHRQMQDEHERLHKSSFQLWRWCYKGCKPCRWFDKIDYEKKICKYCLRFKTFKSLGTILLIAAFFYIFMFSVFKEELLPGGTIFFLFVLFLLAYFAGYLTMLIGLPTMIGHLATGIIFGNLPPNYLPPRDDELLEAMAQSSEEVLLVIALMRAGLLLDFSRIESRIHFIIRLAIVPVICEVLLVAFFSHYMLEMPWAWGTLQGSAMSIISLASIITLMEKNRLHGYGEDKHLSTVLIAASALNVIFSLFVYVVCVEVIFPEGNSKPTFWTVLMTIGEEILLGVLVGGLSGVLIAFFPDKRHSEAAALRILIIGIGSFALANVFRVFSMTAAGALSCLTMTVVAGNMWEELGWHKVTNPVQYFYTVLYYFAQPVVISLLGFTMRFNELGAKETGYLALVLVIGLFGRILTCFLVTFGDLYPTTIREKVFICIAWTSKGTFQALLTFALKYMITGGKLEPSRENKFLKYSLNIKESAILAILLTTPLVSYSLTLLSPKLLTKNPSDATLTAVSNSDPERMQRFPSLRFGRKTEIRKSSFLEIQSQRSK